MTTPVQELEVIVPIRGPIQPATPLILASTAFLSTLKNVESQIASLNITDAHSAQEAATLQNRLTTAGKTLDRQRLDYKRPFMEMADSIDAAAKPPQARIKAAKDRLSKMQTDYTLEQTRLAREAEAARLKEVARLEALQREQAKKEEEAREKAAADATASDFDFEEPATAPSQKIEQEIAVLQAAPVAVAEKAVGVRMRVTLFPHVEDVNKLLDVFVEKSAKLPAIRAAYCTGWKDGQPIPVCPGVRFEVQRTTESTGRAQF